MEHRTLGRTGRDVSVVGLGTWQLGADWGEVSSDDAAAVLEAAVESGVTFLDTADVYGDGRSEQAIAAFRRAHPDLDLTVATKMGRRLDQVPENYVRENFRAWTERSRRNLDVDTLDLVQLHCPPTAVVEDDEVYDALDTLVDEGVLAAYGVSVETCDQALAAIARPNVASIQIILNAFRLKPLDGEAFDVGETFSGVDFEVGVQAAQEFAALLPDDVTPAQAALAWVVAQDGVSTVIPGARNPEQARGNASAADVTLDASVLEGVRRIYDAHLRESVHPRW
jgi:aryl-alcohol dehydrogenase-like predicted oxidoreductase